MLVNALLNDAANFCCRDILEIEVGVVNKA